MNSGLHIFANNCTWSQRGLTDRFQALLESFAQTAAAAGVQIQPYSGNRPRFFEAMAHEAKVATLRDFNRYASVCSDALKEGDCLKDDNALLWRFIKRLHHRPGSDLFSLFEDEDVIEVYDLSTFIQIYRNFRFFEVSSYTLDDILCRPFWDLYQKDPIVTEETVALANSLATQEQNTTLRYDGSQHSLVEVDSVRKNCCIVENRFIAPLYTHNGQTGAAVHVARCLSVTSQIEETNR